MLKICDNIDKQLDKLEFGGESPLTIRAWCGAFRYFPDPLGIVTAEQFDKLEFCGDAPAGNSCLVQCDFAEILH